MSAPNEINVTQLNRLIGTPDCPAIVDVSLDQDFDADPFLIPGACRHSHEDPDALARRLGTGRAVISCQRGGKLSQGLVSWLRADGINAEYLKGGNLAWREDPATSRIPSASITEHAGGSTLWVTRHRPKIDRIACTWLIRRFVDPSARFLFVSPGEVQGVAQRYGATPFDVEDTLFSHRGETCTFDTMLEIFGLGYEALARMAIIVRGADTNRHDLAPQAAGLLAISVGLSRQYSDDHQQLAAGMSVYDALFRWARDGFDEGHDWPAGRAS